jgi:hypothetical protein
MPSTRLRKGQFRPDQRTNSFCRPAPGLTDVQRAVGTSRSVCINRASSAGATRCAAARVSYRPSKPNYCRLKCSEVGSGKSIQGTQYRLRYLPSDRRAGQARYASRRGRVQSCLWTDALGDLRNFVPHVRDASPRVIWVQSYDCSSV